MAILVGLGFRARSGKDTVADYMVANHGFVKMAFADLLKEGVNLWHGWDERHAYGDLKEVVDPFWGYSPRHAYQKVGTEGVRNVLRPDFWVMALWRKASRLMEKGINVVVTDVRFPNEGDFLTASGAHLCLVHRPSLGPLPDDAHVSETAMQSYGWPEVLVNDSDLSSLYAKVDLLVERLVG